MPLVHCERCHHEWETGVEYPQPKCDWCKAEGYILEEKTHFENFMEQFKMNLSEIIDQLSNREK